MQNCTILCPIDEPKQVIDALRDLVQEDAVIRMTGKDSEWTKIKIKTESASLTLNRLVRDKAGDSFSKMVLGMHNYFRQIKTKAKSTQKDVLSRVENMAMAIGVVAEPEFVAEERHYDYIFGVAAALDAIIWTGNGVINADGKLILDEDGDSEVA